MSTHFQPLNGMADIAGEPIAQWQELEQAAREVFATYAFTEVRTPVLERTDVFMRHVGETTDMVSKEMYRFEDRGGRDICLRPEGTAGVMRYVAGGGHETQQARLYYMGPMFRCERPQKGRYRQFHQIGVEAIGEPNPLLDVEVIALQHDLLKTWGLKDLCFQLNSLGTAEDRQAAAAGFREAIEPHKDRLGDQARQQMEKNIFRLLDSKDPEVQKVLDELPPLSSYIQESANAYLDQVQSTLTQLEIPFKVNPRLVRGLDYYVHTVWEVTSGGLGAQDALSGGGRYRFNFGKKDVEGVGFAVGIERVLLALSSQKVPQHPTRTKGYFMISQNETALQENMSLMKQLRNLGIPCRMVLEPKGMKAQFKQADKAGLSHVLIRGEEELNAGTCQIKDLETGEQKEILVGELKQNPKPA